MKTTIFKVLLKNKNTLGETRYIEIKSKTATNQEIRNQAKEVAEAWRVNGGFDKVEFIF